MRELKKQDSLGTEALGRNYQLRSLEMIISSLKKRCSAETELYGEKRFAQTRM